MREAGSPVKQRIDIGASDLAAIGRGGQRGSKAQAGQRVGDRNRAAGGGLVIVVEKADIGPALHIRVKEVVVGDVQRHTQRIGHRQKALQLYLDLGQQRYRHRKAQRRSAQTQRQAGVDRTQQVAQRHLQ